MTQRYTKVAISLHWLVALLIICGYVLGEIMIDMKFSPAKLQYYAWHKWMGITVFLLAFVRLGWRLTHPPPPPLPGPAWQLRLASITHIIFYILIFAAPISGWLYSSSAGFKTVYLGLIPIPDLLDKSPDIKGTLKTVHEAFTHLLCALFVLHVLAVCKHWLINRDQTLARMLPNVRSKKREAS